MKTILVFNPGSSSLKFELFQKNNLDSLVSGQIERVGLDCPFVSFQKGRKSGEVRLKRKVIDEQRALEVVIGFLVYNGFHLADILKVGYRVVHGGERFVKPVRITPRVLRELDRLTSLAPLHNPRCVSVIRSGQKLLPRAAHFAGFDTAYFKDIPPEYSHYNLPEKYYKEYKIRRYGFHGLSHEFVATETARVLKKPLRKLNLIICHVGAGVSVTALFEGKPLTTSMGFTPLEGIMMTTRSGSMDPAIPLYLIQSLKMTPTEVHELLNFQSGWYGISGAKDFRQIMVDAGYKIAHFKKRVGRKVRERSRFALKKLTNDIRLYIGGYGQLLGKVDAVVFTGSIGSRNAEFRKLVMSEMRLHRAKILAITTNEELMIARQIVRK